MEEMACIISFASPTGPHGNIPKYNDRASNLYKNEPNGEIKNRNLNDFIDDLPEGAQKILMRDNPALLSYYKHIDADPTKLTDFKEALEKIPNDKLDFHNELNEVMKLGLDPQPVDMDRLSRFIDDINNTEHSDFISKITEIKGGVNTWKLLDDNQVDFKIDPTSIENLTDDIVDAPWLKNHIENTGENGARAWKALDEGGTPGASRTFCNN
ncbi:MAG: hypothetical protein AAFU64_17715 [Bacteroidota bacterium]